MIIHEDFTRCECGEALLKVETFVAARYNKGIVPATNLAVQRHDPFRVTKTETHYTCKGCDKLINIIRE